MAACFAAVQPDSAAVFNGRAGHAQCSASSFRTRLLARARNPYSRSWLWIPGSCFARPGMTGYGLRLPRFRASLARMFTTFRGGQSGGWRITSISRVKGETLPRVPALSVVHSETIALPILSSATAWRLAGTTSHLRYTERTEKEQLAAVQAGLG